MFSKLKLNWLITGSTNSTRPEMPQPVQVVQTRHLLRLKIPLRTLGFLHQSQANSRPKHHFASYLVFKERSKSETWFYAGPGLTSMAFKKNFWGLDQDPIRAQNGITHLRA